MSIFVGCRSPARVLCVPSRALRAQVVHAMCEALTTTRAVARLHGKTTSFVDGVVASVSTPRLLCFLAMQAFRLIVSSLLCYGGAYFIGHTIALSDLILNCIALEVSSSPKPSSCLALSCLLGCVPSIRSACACFVWDRAPRTVDPVPCCMLCRKRTVLSVSLEV